jgi:hypothetical protein
LKLTKFKPCALEKPYFFLPSLHTEHTYLSTLATGEMA